MEPFDFGVRNKELPRMSCTVYVLVDPRTSIVRYVGSAVDMKARFRGHLQPSVRNKPVGKWVRELAKLDLEPTIKRVAAFTNRAEMRSFERWLIGSLQPRGNLLNISHMRKAA